MLQLDPGCVGPNPHQMSTKAQESKAPRGAGSTEPVSSGASLADLLVAPALSGARVVPADANLDVPVRSLTLADADAPPQRSSLVIFSDAPRAPLPGGCTAVLARMPPSEPLAVPTVVLRRGAPWGAVLADVAEVLASGGGLHRAAEARERFRRELVEGSGYAGLVSAAMDLLGSGVAVLDEYLDISGLAGLTESEEKLLEEAVGRARGHGPASLLGPFIETELEDLIRYPVGVTSDPVGVIVIWRPPPPDPDQLAVLSELSVACTLERARDTARMETEARLRGELIEELMAGEAVNRESLVRRARNLGADLSGGAVAILGRLHDPHTDGRVITDQRLIRRFLQQAQATIGLSWPLSLVEWDAGQLLCLLPPTPEELREATPEEIEAAATTASERLLAATRETVPGLALTLALSRFTPDADRLGAALDEARLALSIGERLGRVGDVITFEETGTYKLLFQIFADRPDELSRFYEQTLAPVVRYDEQYKTDLVGTLSTYLGHDGNLAATANTLYTHRHTVRYRLDRIAELSGLDISKTDDREKLSLGLKSMRLLGKRVAERDERDLP